MADVPPLARSTRLAGAERNSVAQELLRRYNSGKSIREICGETGYSIGRVRRLLDETGVSYRSRGGATVKRAAPRSSPARDPSGEIG